MKQLNIALSDEIRARLEEAAERNGRTIAAEVRERLEQTLQAESTEKQTLDFLSAVTRLMDYVRQQTGWAWHKHPAAHDAFRYAITTLLDRSQPEEPAGDPPHKPVPLVASKDAKAIGMALEALAFSAPDVIVSSYDAALGYRVAAAVRRHLIELEVEKANTPIRRRGKRGQS